MQNKYPYTEDNKKDIDNFLPEEWQIKALQMNPKYVSWGPNEDYMSGDPKYPHSWLNPVFEETWKDFEPSWELNDLNECVNFYYSLRRETENCLSCNATGYNPETKELNDTFYGSYNPYTRTTDGWSNQLTQNEVDALWEANRFFHLHNRTEKPTVEEANKYSHHDAINRWILLETRAKRLGVWGHCYKCESKGYIYTENTCHLQLTLWILHPRKGCSRGVEIKHLNREDLLKSAIWLTNAKIRNANRFAGLDRLET